METTTITDLEGSKELGAKTLSESELDYDSKEVFFELSRSDLESYLSEILEKYQSLQSRYKDLKQVLVVSFETRSELEKDFSSLNEKLISLESNNSTLKNKISKLEEEIVSEAPGNDCIIIYDRAFQYFMAKSIDKSKMDYLVYGVSRNGKKGLGCT